MPRLDMLGIISFCGVFIYGLVQVYVAVPMLGLAATFFIGSLVVGVLHESQVDDE